MLSMRAAPRFRARRPAPAGQRAAERHRSVMQGTWPDTVRARRADPCTDHADRDQQVTWARDWLPTTAYGLRSATSGQHEGPAASLVTCWNGPPAGPRREPGDVLERPRPEARPERARDEEDGVLLQAAPT